MRKVPIGSTLVVTLAAVIMVALGLWQLGRAGEKEALLASYSAAGSNPSLAPFPASEAAAQVVLYRRSAVTCEALGGIAQVAGTSVDGRKGWAHRATCRYAGGADALVDLGWSADPAMRAWAGGRVAGIIAPGPRLVADPPAAGLDALARPDPADLPNNHLSYAVQWFLFAITALVIYGFALRRRLRERQPGRS